MSFRAADLIKRHIVQVDTGLIVGHVEDLVVNPDPQRVMALVTISPRWKREATVIPWSLVRVASGDVILVDAGVEPQPISVYPELQELIERRIRLNGTPVISESGLRFGSIHDLLLEDDGLIIGYVLSYGFLGTDRRYVAAGAVKAVGPDAIVALDGSLRELGEIQQSLGPRLILPFTGTPISLDEVELIEQNDAPSLMSLPEPATPYHERQEMLVNDGLAGLPDSAVAEGEALMPHPPVEPPPITSQESAGEMLLDVDSPLLEQDGTPIPLPQAVADDEVPDADSASVSAENPASETLPKDEQALPSADAPQSEPPAVDAEVPTPKRRRR